MIPGEYILRTDDIIANEGKESIVLKVINTGDRPVQVGSHFHFFEVNKNMLFDRALAFGARLDIPSGTAVRFEPGEEKEVKVIPIGGSRYISGFSNLVEGDANESTKEAALTKLIEKGFKHRAS